MLRPEQRQRKGLLQSDSNREFQAVETGTGDRMSHSLDRALRGIQLAIVNQ